MVNRFPNIFMQLNTISLSEKMSLENLNNNGLMGNRSEESPQHQADLF